MVRMMARANGREILILFLSIEKRKIKRKGIIIKSYVFF